jgi:hypothetical protein
VCTGHNRSLKEYVMTVDNQADTAGQNTPPAGGPGAQNETQAELLATVRLLAGEIGPRPSAGTGERKAAAFVIDRLRHAGYEVELEPFEGLTTYSWTYAPLYGALALAGWLGPRRPALGALLGLGAFGAFLAESLGFEAVARLPFLPHDRSQNVVARLPLPESSSAPERRVILVAHLDSARSALVFQPRLVRGFRATFVGLTAAMATVALGNLARWVQGPRREDPEALDRATQVAGSALLFPLAVLLQREAAMPVVAGANDNASGVAVVLAAAERLAAALQGALDQKAELWVVFTGCEESGLGGMQHFLAAHGHELDPASTLFINVDNVGAGMLTLVNQEGTLWPLLADSELLDAATRMALRRGLHFQTRGYHAMPTDAQVPLARGYRALSVMAFDEHGALPNWHWPTDTPDAVDATTMESALDLLVRTVRRLAAGPGRRIG